MSGCSGPASAFGPEELFPPHPTTSANEITAENDRGNHSLKSAMKGVSPLGWTRASAF
jgi:hypothetical protein